MKTKSLLLSLLFINLLQLSACNTMEGFGQDVQNGGRAIERSAQDNKDARTD